LSATEEDETEVIAFDSNLSKRMATNFEDITADNEVPLTPRKTMNTPPVLKKQVENSDIVEKNRKPTHKKAE